MKHNNIYISILFITIFTLIISCSPDPKAARQLMDKGLREFYSGRYEKAIDYFDQGIKKDPGQYELFFYRGSSWFNLKEVSKAMDDFNHAIALNPAYADAYSTRGDIYLYLRKKEEACKDYREAQRLGKPNMQDKIRYCPD